MRGVLKHFADLFVWFGIFPELYFLWVAVWRVFKFDLRHERQLTYANNGHEDLIPLTAHLSLHLETPLTWPCHHLKQEHWSWWTWTLFWIILINCTLCSSCTWLSWLTMLHTKPFTYKHRVTTPLHIGNKKLYWDIPSRRTLFGALILRSV